MTKEKDLVDLVEEVKIATKVKATKETAASSEIKRLESELKSLKKTCSVLQKTNNRLILALQELELSVSTSEQVNLDGTMHNIISRWTAKDLLEAIKKRNVSEGQTCIVLDREGN